MHIPVRLVEVRSSRNEEDLKELTQEPGLDLVLHGDFIITTKLV